MNNEMMCRILFIFLLLATVISCQKREVENNDSKVSIGGVDPKRGDNCIQNFEPVGNGIKIHIDKVNMDSLFYAKFNSNPHDHHYTPFNSYSYSTIEIDSNTLKVVSEAYSLFRAEVQQGQYHAYSALNDSLRIISSASPNPIEVSSIFLDSNKLPISSFPNYSAKLPDNQVSQVILLGQKFIELMYWWAKGEQNYKGEVQKVCFELTSKLQLDTLAIQKAISEEDGNLFLQQMIELDNAGIQQLFLIGYMMEYRRVCHILYQRTPPNKRIYSYLRESTAEGELLMGVISEQAKNNSHLVADLKHIARLYNKK